MKTCLNVDCPERTGGECTAEVKQATLNARIISAEDSLDAVTALDLTDDQRATIKLIMRAELRALAHEMAEAIRLEPYGVINGEKMIHVTEPHSILGYTATGWNAALHELNQKITDFIES